MFFALCALVLTSCAQGGGGDQVQVSAVLNGVDIADTEPNDPVTLVDDETAQLELTMENVTSESVTVRFVRFEGEVLDMTFLTYDTSIRVELAPGETRAIPPVLLDFYDLGGQATGYLRGHVQLFDEAREIIGSQPVFLDADGDGFSTLAWFNLLLLVGTAGGLGWNLMRLAQRRLPSNRFVRALRFLAIGGGAGLTLAVAFSTLSLWPLGTFAWILFTVVGAIIGYAVGFILPGADDDLDDLLDEQDVLDAVIDEETELVLEGDKRATVKLD
jgi:hypothetical protein